MMIPYYVAIFALLLGGFPAMSSDPNRQWSRQSKDQWFETCLRKRNKPVRQGRIEMQRYGISVEIPSGMQLEMNESGGGGEVIIASVKSIAAKSCIREASILHDQDIGGGSYAYIGIAEGSVTVCQEIPDYCGKPSVISFLGQNQTLFAGRDEYINARNPYTGKKFHIYFHAISERHTIIRLIRSAQKSR